MCSSLERHNPHWPARHLELLLRYSSVDLLKVLLGCRQNPPIAGELHILHPLHAGIHTCMCALTARPSGWKERAQRDGKKELNCSTQTQPTTRMESLVTGPCFGSKRWDFSYLYTSPSLFCSKDLDRGSEIQCEAWDRCGFIPDWEVKVPTMLFLTWRASYLAV